MTAKRRLDEKSDAAFISPVTAVNDAPTFTKRRRSDGAWKTRAR
jgi:hypothetical protein